jgi:hypothetical protein
MSVADRLRDWMDRRQGLGPAFDAGAPAATVDVDPVLASRQEALIDEVAEAQFDLGGLAYEMAIRDHFVLEVLIRRAARLQELDAELAEVERLVRLREGAVSGACRGCGALHSRGAVFCWQCGDRLLEATPSGSALHRAPPG